MTKCPACGKGTLHANRVQEKMFGIPLGEFPAEVCSACGESFLGEEAMADLEKAARAAGVWGLGKKAKVARSGNSLVIRIPSQLARYLHLKAGTEVFVHPEGEDKIVVDVEG